MNLSKNLLPLLLFVVSWHSACAQTCETGKLDERVAAYIKKAGADLTLEQLKAGSVDNFRKGPAVFKKLPEDSVKRITITSDNIRVNVVKANAKKDLPVIINFHRGGFIVPLTPWMEYEALYLSKKFDALVFDIDYRVAPEHKFPTALNDAYNAFAWVVDHAEEFGGNPNKIILHGSSAGATLVALVMHRAKKEGKVHHIKLSVLNCPPTDNPMISYYDSYESNAQGYWLTKNLMTYFFQTYLDKPEWYRNNPDIFPIYEKDLTGLPPSLIITTEFDVLRDEGVAYGRKLEAAGNQVVIKCFPHQIHTLTGLPQNAGEVQRVYELMGEEITKALTK